MLFVDPRSTPIQEPIKGLAHLVPKLLSMAFEGGFPVSKPLAVAPPIGRLVPVHELDEEPSRCTVMARHCYHDLL